MQISSRMLGRLAAGPLALAAVGAVAAAGTVGTATASASPGGWQVVGHVYVNDNTTGTNTIAGFDRHADGTLTPIPGSPFAAGGAGTGAGLASQSALTLSSNGRFVIAVDAGSDQLSVLRVNRDGALTAVGSVPSGGSDPVSVAEHDGLVYVANASATEPNYSGFWLTPWGALRPLDGSTVTLPDGSQPGDVLFNATGTRLVGTRVGTSLIDSFTVGWNGRLTEAPGAPDPAQGVGPFGSAFSPTRPDQLFVTNAHNAPGDSTVSTFIDGWDGALTPLASSPVANGQSGSCWAAISPDGRTLYSVNTGSGTITNYAVSWGGALTVLHTLVIRDGAGAGNSVDAAVSPDGGDVYVVENKTNAIAEFAVQGSQLQELAGDPVALPAGASAAGIAVR